MSTDRHKRPESQGRRGRIVQDERGRNVWQWDNAPSDGTTNLLKQLDYDSLSLQPTGEFGRPDFDGRPSAADDDAAAAPAPSVASDAPDASAASREPRAGGAGRKPGEARLARKPGGGFNPYDNS